MKRTPRILAIILPLLLLLGGTTALSSFAVVSALETQEQKEKMECATPEELIQQLQENEGGTITLTDNIIWDNEDGKDISILQVSRPTVVKMDDFSISIPQECALFIDGPIHFEGSGTEHPMFSVDGWLRTRNVKISAKGDAAVAMKITPYGDWISEYAEVSVEGEHATAIRVEGNDSFPLEATKISATGKNSIGVHAGGPVNLTLCSISSQGVSILSEAGEIVLDATQAKPEPDDAQIIQRKAIPLNRIQENGICIAAGSSEEDLRQKLNTPTFALCDVDGTNSLSGSYIPGGETIWDNLPEDLSNAGDFLAKVTILAPDWFPIELPVLEVPIHVIEPGTPFLQDAQDAGDAAFLRFFSKIEEKNATLRYSIDGGNTWMNAGELPDTFLHADGASVEPLEHNCTYLFQLETEQDGQSRFSNILRFPFYDDINQNGGGDRDNGDREDQGETPPHGEIIPPPTHLPEEEETVTPEEWTADPENEASTSSDTVQGISPMENQEKGKPAGQTTPENPETAADGNVPVPKAASPSINSPDLIENKLELPPYKEASASVQRIPDAATITLTAAELADQLTANPQGITLLGNGMNVTLPASIVKNIPLAKGQSFSAELKAEADNRFRIRFWAGDEEFSSFGEESFSVGFAYETAANDSGAFLCKNTEGSQAVASSYENGKLFFQLSSAGEYTIFETETSKSAEPVAMILSVDKEDSPSPLPSAWPFVAGGAGIVTCALISVGILRYKKKQKRR